jgi:MinD-like ATPase involved in chromosome partitioning or flagellar assembly
MTGTVITFYSYKGGVGRSFTLTNVAVLLARWGYRVLTIDWDLEAPGLTHYFRGLVSEPSGGVVDLASDFLAGAKTPRDHIVQVDVGDGVLHLLASGVGGQGYRTRLQEIDWAELYERGFATFLERCRERWVANYDFVLIDSRTGISDISGICTAHLPDRLVVVFTANDQNLDDVVDIAHLADTARDRLPYDRPRHLVLPILSRLDSRVEYQRAEQWQRKCAGVVAPLFRNWMHKTVTEEQMLRHLTVPYVSYWSFGEQLPVREEPVPSPDQISFALETVAAVIAQQFDHTDLLIDNRDAYVAAARTRHRDFAIDLVVSSPRSAVSSAVLLVEELRVLGLKVEASFSGDPTEIDKARHKARHLCLVVDREVTRWQMSEAERFLRHTLSPESGQRQLFCVLTKGTDRERLPGFLRNLGHLRLEPGVPPASVALELHGLITGSHEPGEDPDRDVLLGAVAALRQVPGDLPYPSRWALVEDTLRGMAAALDDGDLGRLHDLSVDLELLGKAHGGGITTPPAVRARLDVLLNRIERRI